MTKSPPTALALLLALAACDDAATSVICPDIPSPAVVVQVSDALSGEPLPQASGSWTVGEVGDSLRHLPHAPGQLAAFGPPGEYTLRVVRPGYAVWRRSGVAVADHACGPATVQVSAPLLSAEATR